MKAKLQVKQLNLQELSSVNIDINENIAYGTHRRFNRGLDDAN